METGKALEKAKGFIDEAHETLMKLRSRLQNEADENLSPPTAFDRLDDLLSQLETMRSDISEILPNLKE